MQITLILKGKSQVLNYSKILQKGARQKKVGCEALRFDLVCRIKKQI
jgi:hypothetical protein